MGPCAEAKRQLLNIKCEERERREALRAESTVAERTRNAPQLTVREVIDRRRAVVPPLTAHDTRRSTLSAAAGEKRDRAHERRKIAQATEAERIAQRKAQRETAKAEGAERYRRWR
jgi:hypothetical protein